MSEPATSSNLRAWIVSFGLLLASAAVLGLAIASRTLSASSSWLAIAFSAAAIGVSVYSVAVGGRRG